MMTPGPVECIIVLFFIAVPVTAVVIAVIIGKRTSIEISPKTEAGDPRLVRIPQRKTIGGVCAGFAYKFGIPTWLVQVIWVVATFGLGGVPLIAYIILAIVMPKASESPADYDTRTESF